MKKKKNPAAVALGKLRQKKKPTTKEYYSWMGKKSAEVRRAKKEAIDNTTAS